MKVLATAATGSHQGLLELSGPTFRAFAAKHGYEVVVGDGDSGGRAAAWAKVLLLQRLLVEADLVLWIDADAMILDDSEDIAETLEVSSFQGLVSGPFGPNTGVWLVRRSSRATAFLDAVWNIDLPQDQLGWWENSAVLHLLGYDITSWPSRRLAETEWAKGTQWLPEEWNRVTIWDDWRGARIHHVAGERHALRILQMRADQHHLAGHKARAWVFRVPWMIIRRLRLSRWFGRVRHLKFPKWH